MVLADSGFFRIHNLLPCVMFQFYLQIFLIGTREMAELVKNLVQKHEVFMSEARHSMHVPIILLQETKKQEDHWGLYLN